MAEKDEIFKLPPPPKNIFVTQIKDDLESSDQLRLHPVVKQNAASLVKDSANTQQSTLLLQKEQELSEADKLYRDSIEKDIAKKRNFKKREAILQDKRKKLDDRKQKFAGYIKDEKFRQQKALNKIELVRNEIEDKVNEINELEEERGSLRERNGKIITELTEVRKYKIMLEKAAESMPDGYLEPVIDSFADSLILKYNTLKDTNNSLQERLQNLNELLEREQIQLALDSQLHGTDLLAKNQSLSKNQSILETERGQRAMLDQLISMKDEYARDQKRTLGKAELAIDNIGDICYQHRYSRKKPTKMSLFKQLDLIQDFILDLEQTVKLAVKLSEES